jgi:hypothetical protein
MKFAGRPNCCLPILAVRTNWEDKMRAIICAAMLALAITTVDAAEDTD